MISYQSPIKDNLYRGWDFCKSINCEAMLMADKEKRKRTYCTNCKAYIMHQYLKTRGQILEEGSELADKVKIIEQVENIYLTKKQLLRDAADTFNTQTEPSNSLLAIVCQLNNLDIELDTIKRNFKAKIYGEGAE